MTKLEMNMDNINLPHIFEDNNIYLEGQLDRLNKDIQGYKEKLKVLYSDRKFIEKKIEVHNNESKYRCFYCNEIHYQEKNLVRKDNKVSCKKCYQRFLK